MLFKQIDYYNTHFISTKLDLLQLFYHIYIMCNVIVCIRYSYQFGAALAVCFSVALRSNALYCTVLVYSMCSYLHYDLNIQLYSIFNVKHKTHITQVKQIFKEWSNVMKKNKIKFIFFFHPLLFLHSLDTH